MTKSRRALIPNASRSSGASAGAALDEAVAPEVAAPLAIPPFESSPTPSVKLNASDELDAAATLRRLEFEAERSEALDETEAAVAIVAVEAEAEIRAIGSSESCS